MTTRALAAKPAGNRFTRFFTGIWAEMRKVVWLSRREVLYLTMLVLLVTIITGVILGVFDFAFSTGVDKLLIGS
jgi:preprotein translocase subunit SecE